jgi:sorbitol-specific phosphotransferase system component IIC
VQVKKQLRAQEIAKENGLPCIYLGAHFPILSLVFVGSPGSQSSPAAQPCHTKPTYVSYALTAMHPLSAYTQVFPDREHFGRIFYNMVRGARVPACLPSLR